VRHADLWERLRAGFGFELEERDRAALADDLDWWRERPDHLERTAERAYRYLHFIVTEIERRGLPTELALIPFLESGFEPFARSPARAVGLWQFMPSTGRAFGLRQGWWYDGRRDVVAATRAALDYLEKLHADFDGDWLLAVAAYNAGEGNLQRAIRRNRERGDPIDFWSLELPGETRGYVPRLLAIAAVAAQPEAFGLALPRIPDDAYFKKVELPRQIDLAVAADIAGVDLDELYRLNAGYHRWATDPEGPHRLLVPATVAHDFGRRLAALPADQWMQWEHHQVAAGETLAEIAQRYRTTTAALSQANGLRGSTLSTGARVKVPAGPREAPDVTPEIRRALHAFAPPAGERTTYVVRPGDSLWRIAQRHQLRVRDLASWNRMTPGATLRPGQRLTLWRQDPDPASAAPAVAASERALEEAAGIRVHVVRAGDSLWSIARRYSVTVASLSLWNRLSTNSTLRPGQKLRVGPAPRGAPSRAHRVAPATGPDTSTYTVRTGDSLWDISRRFRVSVAALEQHNALPRGTVLRPGQAIEVPASDS
jgi:membrane-bound lytic murein transglycosylase D